MAMLLVIHSVGYSGMPSLQPREQDSQDIDLVREAAEILAKVGTNNGGTAALESSKIIQGILGHWAAGSGSHPRRCETLKICLPYFGAITICPGKVLAEQLQRKPRVPEPFYRCQKQQPPLCPLLAAADGPNGDKQRNLVGQTSTDPQSEYLNSPQFRLEGAPSFSDAGWELSGFFDDFGYGLWSGLDINHGLDQG
ncbi:hypothetical protein BDV36DRAFT_250938 [Aspergillus pseudocaelatus]|uniref:Uncharacterized protein n=1 Tax=Aspergillus pseudocaelatus TaxID=1825620 RepID=A0ABQ6WRV9_9EURO|nr:hypothetical protein BDV36DRAFT_250938 [Aspergillus pseudocaelatus]